MRQNGSSIDKGYQFLVLFLIIGGWVGENGNIHEIAVTVIFDFVVVRLKKKKRRDVLFFHYIFI